MDIDVDEQRTAEITIGVAGGIFIAWIVIGLIKALFNGLTC